jgi:hypothetical protein
VGPFDILDVDNEFLAIENNQSNEFLSTFPQLRIMFPVINEN